MSRTALRSSVVVLFTVLTVAYVATARVGSWVEQAAVSEAAVDKVFARWSASTPGCAVGVGVDGRVVLAKAYGMASLEYDVPNTADTIFEAGSVAKQFTAAAMVLLAQDGKLSLDDPVRKHIPELPDYGVPLTIRHMLNHTSGLRDWGSVAGIAGWPRTTRVHAHDHVLEIASRQHALNFTPGTRYSYSNTGYNLAAMIVARVSGQSFAEFSQQRIFTPAGMTRTSWRDDHQRVVKGRAVAYSDDGGRFRTLMPFENVHGNGGLLTTVGDLLKWNENFTTHAVGDAAFVRDMETRGRYLDGREHGYALGLMVGKRHGLQEVQHSGSTAGYRAHLTRFPQQRTSVAVLCNVSTGAATQYANTVAEFYLASHAVRSTPPSATHRMTALERDAATGMFRNTVTGEVLNVFPGEGGIRVRDVTFVPTSSTRFVSAGGDTWEIAATGHTRFTDDVYPTPDTYERVTAAKPTAAELQELVGTYVSDDAETTLVAAVDQGTLVLKRRPGTVIRLAPLYKDAFRGSIGTVLFRRGNAGQVHELSVVQDRVWNLPFVRQ